VQTRPELISAAIIRAFRRNASSFLLLVAGLLFLVACQTDKAPTATDSASSLLALTQTQEPVNAGSKPSTSQPTGQTEQTTQRETQPAITLTPRLLPTRTASLADRPSGERETPNPWPPAPTSSPSPPKRGGEVVVGGLSQPDTLDPALAESEASRDLVSLVFDSLTSYDPRTGQLVPRLAETWLIAPDSRTITFTLRTDARWHDGRPVVAEDVVFSVEAARDSGTDSLYGPQLEHVTEVRAIGDKLVVVNLDIAHCPSLAVVGELSILPQHVLAGSESDRTYFASAPLGSGPFVFVDWTPAGEVRLARNDDYWGDVAYLDALAYRPFDTPEELESALEGEQIDVALMPAGYLLDTADPHKFSVYRYPAPEFLFVAFNNDHPILSDSRLRQALSMAVDREQLLDVALNGAGDLIAGSLPTTHWAADPTLDPPSYNPDGARRLLAEAGWSDSDGDGWLDRDGERLRLPVRTNGRNRLRENVASLVAGYYRAIGVEAPVELVLWGAVVDDLFTHDFETMVFSWPLRAEPDQSGWWLSTENQIGSGHNFGSFADEEVDRLLGEAQAMPGCDPGDRAELYRQIQGVLARKRPYDFLVIPYATLLTRSDLDGIEAGSFAGPLESAAGWYLAR